VAHSKSTTRRAPDRRRARTREALLSAGRALFAARDVDGVSIDEIVAAAEVAKGSFYNHFTDKDVFARDPINLIRMFRFAQKHNLVLHPDAMRLAN